MTALRRMAQIAVACAVVMPLLAVPAARAVPALACPTLGGWTHVGQSVQGSESSGSYTWTCDYTKKVSFNEFSSYVAISWNAPANPNPAPPGCSVAPSVSNASYIKTSADRWAAGWAITQYPEPGLETALATALATIEPLAKPCGQADAGPGPDVAKTFRLDLTADPRLTQAGERVALVVEIEPAAAAAGRKVTIWSKTHFGRWTRFLRLTVDAQGHARGWVSSRRAQVVAFKATIPGANGVDGGESRKELVKWIG